MGVKKNLMASYVGQIWLALLNVFCVPVYIGKLGLEGFGVIGVYNIFLAGISIIEAGVSPVLNNKMASFGAGKISSQNAVTYLRTFQFVAVAVAIVIFFVFFCFKDWFSESWLRPKNLSLADIRFSLLLMGGVCGLRLIESVLKSVLTGLQKQIHLNTISIVISTIRHVGAILLVVFVENSLPAFFVWQFLSYILSIAAHAIVIHGVFLVRWSWVDVKLAILLKEKKFIGKAIIAAVLAFLVGQLDKISLSRFVGLHELGYYAAASTLVATLSLVSAPISQVMYPHFVFCVESNERLNSEFRIASQLLSFVLMPVSMVLIYFPYEVIFSWSGNKLLANNIAEFMPFLAAGGLISALMVLPSMLRYLDGQLDIVVVLNFLSILFLSVFYYYAIPKFGLVGASFGWMVLNLLILYVFGWKVCNKITVKNKLAWYVLDQILPFFFASLACVTFRLLISGDGLSRIAAGVSCFVCWFISSVVCFAFLPAIKKFSFGR